MHFALIYHTVFITTNYLKFEMDGEKNRVD